MPLFYYTLSFWLGIKYQKYQSWSWWLPIYRELSYEQLDSFIHELNWRDIDKTIAAGNISISYVSEWKSLSRVRLFETLWTVAPQASLYTGFSREGCWNGLPCPPPGDLTIPGIEPRSPTLQAISLPIELPEKLIIYDFVYNHKAKIYLYVCINKQTYSQILFFINIITMLLTITIRKIMIKTILCSPGSCSY